MPDPSNIIVQETRQVLVEIEQRTGVAVSNSIRLGVEVGLPGLQGRPGHDGSGSITYESAEIDEDAIVGQPLYIKLNGHIGLAQANAIATSRVCGVTAQDAIATTAVQYSFSYPVERTDWTLITGTTYLRSGMTYYLDPEVPGRLTTIAPELSGQLVANVGIAVSPIRLAVNVQIPILL